MPYGGAIYKNGLSKDRPLSVEESSKMMNVSTAIIGRIREIEKKRPETPTTSPAWSLACARFCSGTSSLTDFLTCLSFAYLEYNAQKLQLLLQLGLRLCLSPLACEPVHELYERQSSSSLHTLNNIFYN